MIFARKIIIEIFFPTPHVSYACGSLPPVPPLLSLSLIPPLSLHPVSFPSPFPYPYPLLLGLKSNYRSLGEHCKCSQHHHHHIYFRQQQCQSQKIVIQSEGCQRNLLLTDWPPK